MYFEKVSRIKAFTLLLIWFTSPKLIYLWILDKIGRNSKSYCRNTLLLIKESSHFFKRILLSKVLWSLIGKEYRGHNIAKTFVLYNRITEGLVLRILYPGIRHIKVHSLINPNYSFILNNWNFFEIGQFRLFQNLIICLLPRKTFWFWMLVPAQKWSWFC